MGVAGIGPVGGCRGEAREGWVKTNKMKLRRDFKESQTESELEWNW